MPEPRTTSYPRSGPIRGFLRWMRESKCEEHKAFSRTLFYFYSGKRHYGTCKWCCQPCKRDKLWHNECAKAMMAAKGRVLDIYKRPLFDWRGKGCEKCGGNADEIDHRLALSVAWEIRRHGDRRWWRAWTVGNLRWLCRACHKTKTADDRRSLARLRSPQQQLFDA